MQIFCAKIFFAKNKLCKKFCILFAEQTYATLKFVVRSRRKLSYHVVQTYVPSVLLALVTWLCFLVPREQSEVRVGVAMTTLLTITAMFSSVR